MAPTLMRSSRQTEAGNREASHWAMYLICGAYASIRTSISADWLDCSVGMVYAGVVPMVAFLLVNTDDYGAGCLFYTFCRPGSWDLAPCSAHTVADRSTPATERVTL